MKVEPAELNSIAQKGFSIVDESPLYESALHVGGEEESSINLLLSWYSDYGYYCVARFDMGGNSLSGAIETPWQTTLLLLGGLCYQISSSMCCPVPTTCLGYTTMLKDTSEKALILSNWYGLCILRDRDTTVTIASSNYDLLEVLDIQADPFTVTAIVEGRGDPPAEVKLTEGIVTKLEYKDATWRL